MTKFTFGNFEDFENDFFTFRKSGFLHIANDEPTLLPTVRAKRFNVTLHSFDCLKDRDNRAHTYFVDAIDALFPRGNSTLTKDTGLDYIAEALHDAPKDKPLYLNNLIPKPLRDATPGHIWAYSCIQRILRSPVLKQVLCNPKHNKFPTDGVVVAPLNRAKLTDFEVTAIGVLLIGQSKAQVIIDDLNVFALDMLVRLIREDRLIARVPSLRQLGRKAPELYDAVLASFAADALTLPPSERAQNVRGVLYSEAVVLAEHAGLKPDPDHTINGNPYDAFIEQAMLP